MSNSLKAQYPSGVRKVASLEFEGTALREQSDKYLSLLADSAQQMQQILGTSEVSTLPLIGTEFTNVSLGNGVSFADVVDLTLSDLQIARKQDGGLGLLTNFQEAEHNIVRGTTNEGVMTVNQNDYDPERNPKRQKMRFSYNDWTRSGIIRTSDGYNIRDNPRVVIGFFEKEGGMILPTRKGSWFGIIMYDKQDDTDTIKALILLPKEEQRKYVQVHIQGQPLKEITKN